MKKALFAALCCVLALSACKKIETEVKVTGVSVSPATLSLVEGDSEQLRATVMPSDAANKAVSWTSSATAVATVDNTGKVTAVNAGSATITVKTADGGKTATCAVTVTAKVIPVTGISIDQGATAEVEEGNTITLTATVQPDNATDKTVTWSSSNKAIATVADGVVTGVAAGQAVITAKAGDKEATCTVTVKRPAVALEAVDLGLSVKWANKNLGAEFPENTGDYYAWGETEPKQEFSWDNYKWYDGSAITKYNLTDGFSTLLPEDDAANAALGGQWRLPLDEEFKELVTQCTWIQEGDGTVVKGPNGNTIYIPLTGCMDNEVRYADHGFYWTTTLSSEVYYSLCYGGSSYYSYQVGWADKFYGMAIRPVYGERPPEPTIINPTAEDLGKVIGADGKIYTNTQAAVSAGTKAAAVIVYVGSDTAEDGFTHGLAMSMRDCSNTSGYKWKTSAGTYDNPQQNSDLHTLLNLHESGKSLTTSDRDNDTWPAFKAALHNSITVTDGITADAPDGTSGWFLPSMFQWQQAIHAMTGKTKELSLYDANPDYVNDYFNAKIADPEAFLIKNCYASSSEFDYTYNWHFDFNDGIARRNAKWCTYYVRAFLAF